MTQFVSGGPLRVNWTTPLVRTNLLICIGGGDPGTGIGAVRLSPVDAAYVASLPALAAALGGALGYATHAAPDPALSAMMGLLAGVAALARGLSPMGERSRVGRGVLAFVLFAFGAIVIAREILPDTYFPNL